jgi:hypothetical protein
MQAQQIEISTSFTGIASFVSLTRFSCKRENKKNIGNYLLKNFLAVVLAKRKK